LKAIFWAAYSSGPRHLAIDIVSAIINRFGSIVDFKSISDISLTLVIEVQKCKVDSLYDELKGHIRLDSVENLNSESTDEITVYLNITFSNATGNLTNPILNVPG
jgi:hypothetical protein